VIAAIDYVTLTTKIIVPSTLRVKQEYLQKYNLDLPEYTLMSTKDHIEPPIFTIICKIKSLNIKMESSGPSIKKAEQKAAMKILKIIKEQKIK